MFQNEVIYQMRGTWKKNKRIKLLWIAILDDPNKKNKRTGVCLSSVLLPLPSHSLDSACHNGIKCGKRSLMVCSGSDLSQFTVLNPFIPSACRTGTFVPTLQIGELRLKRIKKL